LSKNDKIVDILLIEDNESVVDIFKIITKKFEVSIKYAKNTNEFIKLMQMFEFRHVLCDLNLDYKYEGLFISKIYNNIRRIKPNNGKIYFFSNEIVGNFDLQKFCFDEVLEKNFSHIYGFLKSNFSFKTYKHFLEIENSQNALISA
jgi:hypothetical protein